MPLVCVLISSLPLGVTTASHHLLLAMCLIWYISCRPILYISLTQPCIFQVFVTIPL